ncbi:MAG: hypothetical protein R3B91_06375 [Planctomycetaceae bacterium]
MEADRTIDSSGQAGRSSAHDRHAGGDDRHLRHHPDGVWLADAAARFPKWRTVYEFYACWRDDGTWETMNARLREQVRRRAGRKSEPRIGVLDSQSVKT